MLVSPGAPLNLTIFEWFVAMLNCMSQPYALAIEDLSMQAQLDAVLVDLAGVKEL